MSFVQQFTEQQLAKGMSSQLLEQIQNCHSGVEELICNLEALRGSPKLSVIDAKIGQFEGYLAVKQELVSILQNSNKNAIMEWLLSNKISSTLITTLLKKDEKLVEEMLHSAVKRSFLRDESMKQFIEENEMLSNGLNLLTALRDDIQQNRTIVRDKVKNIDSILNAIDEKIQAFSANILAFNQEMAAIVRDLESFEQSVSKQFRNVLIKR